MYNPRLKDKYALIDFARHGTKARKASHPNVLIGDYCAECFHFKEGDILDANAVVNLIQDVLSKCQMFEAFIEEDQQDAKVQVTQSEKDAWNSMLERIQALESKQQ